MNICGDSIICPRCNTVSIPPYYSCKSFCPLTISRMEWETIRSGFETKPIACWETRNVSCQGALYSPDHFIQHLKVDHKIRKMYSRQSKNPKALAVVYISAPAEKIGSVHYFRWPSVYFEAEGKTFVISIVYELGKVYWWIVGDFSETRPVEYMATSCLKLNKPSPNFSLSEFTQIQASPIRCLQLYDFEMIKKLGQATMVDASRLLGEFCKAQRANQFQNCFTIKIRVSNKSPSPK